MDIGNRLRELRLARGISVADLGARMRMPQGRIAAVEEGTETPSLDALEAWAGLTSNGCQLNLGIRRKLRW